MKSVMSRAQADWNRWTGAELDVLLVSADGLVCGVLLEHEDVGPLAELRQQSKQAC